MAPLLSVRDLVTEFRDADSGRVNRACDRVSIDVGEAEIVGLVGESGCGKSTLGRSIVGLEFPSAGTIHFDGADVLAMRGRRQRELRRGIQYIFQDPLASLEARQTIGAALHEALVINGERNYAARAARVAEVIASANLPPSVLDRYPRELSGGQRQRVCIARALLVDPKLLICDEPVSSLDVSLRAQVLNLFLRLRDEKGMAILLIAHDLAAVRQASARVNVMYLGRIVETGPSADVYRAPLHPYSDALVSAIPLTNPARERERRRVILSGDLPSPLDPPSGCRFRTRCPRAMPVCDTPPPIAERPHDRRAACHLLTPA